MTKIAGSGLTGKIILKKRIRIQFDTCFHIYLFFFSHLETSHLSYGASVNYKLHLQSKEAH